VNEPLTLAGQHVAWAALAQIAEVFGHLPAPCITVGDVFPDTVQISVHDSLAHFEVWRTALGIPSEAVSYRDLTTTMSLKAPGAFHGATIELTGFAPLLPAPNLPAEGGDGA